MDRPFLLPLAACTQPSLVGGKALGLARLITGGVPVPSGFCVTTEAYDHALRAQGFSPAEQWQAALHSSGVERRRILASVRTFKGRAVFTRVRRFTTRWLGGDWRALLNVALQGQAAVISVQQIVRLAEIVDMVRRDPSVTSLFTAEGWDPVEVRRKLDGTDVLRAFNRYL